MLVTSNKDRCHELINKTLRRSKVIFDGLHKIAASPVKDQLKDMESKLIEYKECAQRNFPFSLESNSEVSVFSRKFLEYWGDTRRSICLTELLTEGHN